MEKKTYHIEFTEEQMQIMNEAVCQMPYRIAAPFIADVNRQLKGQIGDNEFPDAVPEKNNAGVGAK